MGVGGLRNLARKLREINADPETEFADQPLYLPGDDRSAADGGQENEIVDSFRNLER